MQRLLVSSILILTVVFGLLPGILCAQELSAQRVDAASDTLAVVADTLAADTVALGVDSLAVPENRSGLTAVVNYKATDSLVFSMGNMAFLYGQSEVTYDDINLTAERIQLSLDSSLVHANGIPDTASTTGKLIGAPVFKDKSGEYETRTISYNFKSAKGYITDVVTQQGDGYVTGGTTKKMADNDIFLENGRYTTCDYHECPHFYINLTKARVRPGKNIVTGPAYLVVADVPLPLAIPFGFFPFTKSYSSGVIMPTYGADMSRGLYLRDGGYYFAINDYMDLTLKGEVYTKGSWGVSAAQKYAVRYKFSGNYQVSFLKTITGEKGMPDYGEKKDFKVSWSHSQDSRFNPNMTLAASVNYTTSGYDRNNITGYNTQEMVNSTKQSTVNLSYKIPNSKWSISSSFGITQRVRDSTLQVQLPELSVSMSRLYPFKRKVQIGAERWYEKIAMTYSARLTNSITTKQDQFFKKSLIKDWRNGIAHTASLSSAFTVLRYINITPNISFNDRTYLSKTEQYYDPSLRNANGSYGGIAKDTTYGFYNSYNYSYSISANTKLYGMYKPASFIKNAKLVAVRHLFTPTVSFSYNPDFGQKKYGTWGTYRMPDANSKLGYRDVQYSFFDGYSSGYAGRGRSGSINFTFDNNIEAKFRSETDSTGYKKVSIIDKLTTGFSYNLAADSMKWSQTIPLNISIKTGKSGSMNLSGTFDNYMYDLNPSGTGLHHIDKTRFAAGKMPRLMRTSYSYSFQLNNKKVAGWFGHGQPTDSNDETDDGFEEIDPNVENNLDPSYLREKEREREEKRKKKFTKSGYDEDGYMLWEVPWSLSVSYSMNYGYTSKIDVEKKEYKLGITHAATINGSINPTKGWDFSYNMSYDFNLHRVTYMNFNFSRDMHCWTLRASMNPLGRYAHFNVCIAVKSSMLSDLKYEKSSVSGSNKIDWYDD